MKKIIVTAWVTLALALLFGVPAAQACSSPPPVPPITIQFHEMCFPIDDPTDCMLRGWITIHDYTTFASSTNSLCACALSKVGKIKEVLWVKFVDPVTGERFPAWSFDADMGVTTDAEQYLNPSATIEGFLAQTCENLPSGTTLDLMLEVLLEGDASIAEVANALNTSGPVVVTGEANSAGTFINHVMTVPSSGPTTCRVASKTVAYLGDAPELLAARGDTSVNFQALQACDQVAIGPDAQAVKPQLQKGDDIGSLPLAPRGDEGIGTLPLSGGGR